MVSKSPKYKTFFRILLGLLAYHIELSSRYCLAVTHKKEHFRQTSSEVVKSIDGITEWLEEYIPSFELLMLTQDRPRPKFQEPTKAVKQAMKGIPDWLKEYIVWHSDQRKKLHDPSTKFLTVTCYKDHKCAGVSDRIRPMPYYLLLAYKLQRVLFIKWQKFELEDFLLPPAGGIDWRLPKHISIGEFRNYEIERNYYNIWDYNDTFVKNTKHLTIGWVPDVYPQFQKEYFSTKEGTDGSYSDVMDILFEPSPPIADAIKQTMRKLDLVPKQYSVVHYRAPDLTAYHEEMGSLSKRIPGESIKKVINNAISCAVHISNIKKVYFTSSDTDYVEYVLERSPFANNPSVDIKGTTGFFRYHSDKPEHSYDWEANDPSVLYPVFVDLWMMKNSKCVAFTKLGFGRLGSRLNGDDCSVDALRETCPSLLSKH